jgi:chromosome segregation ATPase
VTSAVASVSMQQASLSSAGLARQHTLEQQWSQELAPPVSPETKIVEYKSPIKRVVSLLEKMRAELIAEADKEAEMYDKMVCWCETNEKEKTKAIADAEAMQKELTAEIEGLAAKFGEESTEIERLKTQIAEDTAALKQATAIREKEAAKFYDMNKDLIQWITNVKNAIQNSFETPICWCKLRAARCITDFQYASSFERSRLQAADDASRSKRTSN